MRMWSDFLHRAWLRFPVLHPYDIMLRAGFGFWVSCVTQLLCYAWPNMTASELSALLDAHDVLVKAYVDSGLTFAEFVSAYGDFPHNYALDGHTGTAEERVALRL